MKEKPELTFLVGKRVQLRLFCEADAAQLAIWINNPDTTQYLAQVYPQTIENELEWIKKSHTPPTNFSFGIETIEDEILIGCMGLHRIDHINGTASTGAFIGSEEYRSKGYASEAKLLLLKYAFDTLNLRKICATVIEFNDRSMRYQEKCGYKVEGRRKAQLFRNGRYWDEILVAVFREDWEPIWEASQ